MRPIHRFVPSPSMVVAVAALIVAASGGAVAATLITGASIKNESVTGKDIKNASLTGADVKNRSLGTVDLSTAAVTALKGQRGDPGPAGAQGPQGAPGLIRHTQNAQAGWPISTAPTLVAEIGDNSLATCSGSYSGPLVHPAGVSYLAVNVSAHVLGPLPERSHASCSR